MLTMMTTMIVITRHAHWQDVHCRLRSLAADFPLELHLQLAESENVRRNEHDDYKDDGDYHRYHGFLPRVNIDDSGNGHNVMFVIVIIIMTQILITTKRLKK